MEGKTARGASSPAKPALHSPDPLSITTASTLAAISNLFVIRRSNQISLESPERVEKHLQNLYTFMNSDPSAEKRESRKKEASWVFCSFFVFLSLLPFNKMNFGSSFVLDRLSDCEDDEVLDQGRRLQYSDCEQDLFEADLEPPSPPPVASEAAQPARRTRVLRRRALFDSSSSEDDSTGGGLGSLSSSPPSPPPSAGPD